MAAPSDDEPLALSIQGLRRAGAETSFVTHCMPDIPARSEIIGICTLDLDQASPDQHGWLLTDFLAFKSMLKGFGQQRAQSWLSHVDPAAALGKYGGTYCKDGKSIAGANDPKIEKFADINDLEHAFYDAVAKQASLAAEKKTSLFIFAFGLATPNQDIVLSQDLGHYIQTDQIKEASLGHGEVPVVMLTASLCTGGWTVNPQLGATRPDIGNETLMRILAKSCGGALAQTALDIHTSRDSPFLHRDQLVTERHRDIQPPNATQEQVELLYAVHGKVLECLEKKLDEDALSHSFHFDPSRDEWEEVVGPRVGPSLIWWQSKWEQMEDTQHDDNAEPYQYVGNVFGGSKQSQAAHLKRLACMELDTNTGDWNSHNGDDVVARRALRNFVETAPINIDEARFREMFHIVEFRMSMSLLADILVLYAGLEAPGAPQGTRQTCRFWSCIEYRKHEEINRAQRNVRLAVQGEMNSIMPRGHCLEPGRNFDRNKDPQFYRPRLYLAAAVTQRFIDLSEGNRRRAVIERIYQFLEAAKRTQAAILKSHKPVVEAGMAWLQAIRKKTVDLCDLDTKAVATLFQKMGFEKGHIASPGSQAAKEASFKPAKKLVGISASVHKPLPPINKLAPDLPGTWKDYQEAGITPRLNNEHGKENVTRLVATAPSFEPRSTGSAGEKGQKSTESMADASRTTLHRTGVKDDSIYDISPHKAQTNARAFEPSACEQPLSTIATPPKQDLANAKVVHEEAIRIIVDAALPRVADIELLLLHVFKLLGEKGYTVARDNGGGDSQARHLGIPPANPSQRPDVKETEAVENNSSFSIPEKEVDGGRAVNASVPKIEKKEAIRSSSFSSLSRTSMNETAPQPKEMPNQSRYVPPHSRPQRAASLAQSGEKPGSPPRGDTRRSRSAKREPLPHTPPYSRQESTGSWGNERSNDHAVSQEDKSQPSAPAACTNTTTKSVVDEKEASVTRFPWALAQRFKEKDSYDFAESTW